MPPPSASKRPAWVNDDLYPFAEHYLDIRGFTIHYLDEGDGPALLLLHGNPTWSFLYRHIVLALRSRFRCIAPDLPGFGLSAVPSGYRFTPAGEAEVIAALIEKLNLTGVCLMVHDWGGPIGLSVAARHPERFQGLIIANTWAWPVNGAWRFEAFSRLAGGPAGRFLNLGWNALVHWGIPAGVCTHRLSPQVMAMYRGPFASREARLPTVVFPKAILTERAFLAAVQAGLSRLRSHPVLILWGERDPAFRARERRRFESAFPNHRTVRIPQAGHFIQEDAPQIIAAAITDWQQAIR